MEQRRVLIIADDREVVDYMVRNLDRATFLVWIAKDWATAHAGMAAEPPDLIVLDRDLTVSGVDGLEMCRRIRNEEQGADTPVIILAARGREHDRINGLEAGADDYIEKPFSDRELTLRVKALLRGYRRRHPPRRVLQCGALFVDLESYQVTLEGEPVGLTHGEFKLLAELMRGQGKVRTRTELLTNVWGYSHAGSNTVETHVRRLRRKLGAQAHLVETVRGVGYRFKAEVCGESVGVSTA